MGLTQSEIDGHPTIVIFGQRIGRHFEVATAIPSRNLVGGFIADLS